MKTYLLLFIHKHWSIFSNRVILLILLFYGIIIKIYNIIIKAFKYVIHDVQSSKSAQPDWGNENIYETELQFMYGWTFNDPKKSTWKMCHGYEKEIGDIQILPAQNNFLYILPKHWWSHLTGKRLDGTTVFKTLKVWNRQRSF